MKCNQFEEGEIPYGALEKFGLSHEMIEDLPMHVLEDIWNGRQSPVLPIHVTDDEGELIKSRTRFSLVRMEDGKVDVMFYPVLKYALLEQFDDNQQQLLKDGKAVVADVTSPQGTIIKAFVQIDPETNHERAYASYWSQPASPFRRAGPWQCRDQDDAEWPASHFCD